MNKQKTDDRADNEARNNRADANNKNRTDGARSANDNADNRNNKADNEAKNERRDGGGNNTDRASNRKNGQ